MGRNKMHPVHEHFLYDQQSGLSTCKLCKIILKANHATNLTKHLKSKHGEIAFNVLSKKAALIQDKQCTQQKLEDLYNIKIKMSEKTLIDSCIELVTVNGRPFSIMNDSGFRKIINPILTGLNRKDGFSSESIKTLMTEKANRIRYNIKESVKDKLISLKVDAVSRLDRSFIGINIQYVKDAKIILRTLALVELKEAHTGEYLKQVIFETLKKYEINRHNIYTITTDNGSNMLKAIKNISRDTEEECSSVDLDNDESDNEDSGNADNSANDISDLQQRDDIEIQFEDDIYEDESGMNSPTHMIDQQIEKICINNGTTSTFAAIGMRCAAHTLQLAINDSLREDSRVTNLILKVRKLVRKLRTQTYLYLIKKDKLKKPILDCTTRWSSTVEMLIRLRELKTFVIEISNNDIRIKQFNLSVTEWEHTDNICAALTPAKITTKVLQQEQLTLTDFYSNWLLCKVKTEAVDTPFARIVVKNLNIREQFILSNDVLLSAIFLDLRYKIVLNQNQINIAIKHLSLLWNKILLLKENCNTTTHSSTENAQGSPSSTNSDSSDEIDNLLKSKEMENVSVGDISSPHRIDVLLQSYNVEQERINRKTNLSQYWKSMKYVKPELYVLSKVVFAVPATQVSVERLFSGLKFILSPLRTNISATLLEDQLVIRANCLFEKTESKDPSNGFKHNRKRACADLENNNTNKKERQLNINDLFNSSNTSNLIE